MAAAVFSPASGLVALAVAVAVVAVGGGRRAVGITAVAGLVANLPWLVPSLLYAGSLHPVDGQFAAFAAKGESGAGVLASVLSLGGIWKASVVPAERGSAVIVVLSCLLTLVALVGLRLAAAVERRLVLGLGVVGGAALLLVLATAIPPVAALFDEASSQVPALGLLRDTHRLPGAVRAGAGAGDRCRHRVAGRARACRSGGTARRGAPRGRRAPPLPADPGVGPAR